MVVFISVGWQQWFHPLLFKIRTEVVNFHCAIQLSQDFVLAWMGGDKSSGDVRLRVTCLYKLSASSRLAMERLFSLKITTRNVKGGCKCKREVTLLVYWRRAAVSAPIWPSGKALSLFLTGWVFVLRTVRRTMIRLLTELLVRRIWFGQSKLYFILNWLVMRCKFRPELAADAQRTAWSKM